MTNELRNDLMMIVLEEAYGMREDYARQLVANGPRTKRFNRADTEAVEGASNIVNRIDARCSRIEG